MNDTREPQNGGAGTATAERPSSGDPSAKRLVRRTDQKMVAGVAAGVADYTGLDVALVRVGFVLLAIFSGVGLIAYLAGWILLPPFDDPDAPPPIHGSGAGGWIGIGLIVLAVSLLVHELGFVRDDIFWPLLLIGIGVALWTTSSSRSTRSPSPDGPPTGSPGGGPPSPGGTDPAVGATDVREALAGLVPAAGAGHGGVVPEETAFPSAGSGAGAGAMGPGAAEVSPRPAPKDRERSMLGRLTSGAVVLALGVGLLLDNLDVVELSFQAALASMLVVMGGGLILGAWWGRARWLIVPGAIVATALLLSNFATANLDPAFGPRHVGYRVGEQMWRPGSVAELRSSYRMLGGRMVVDLSDLERVRDFTRTELRLGFGELVLRLPPDIPVDVTTSAEAGEIHLFGQRSDGLDVRRQYRDPATRFSGPGEPRPGRLVVDAHVGFGEIHVERGAR